MPRIQTACLRATPLRALVVLLLLVTGAALAVRGEAAPRGGAKADPRNGAKKAPGGSTYRNAQLGVRARGPAGWRMFADKGDVPTSWRRLVRFTDTATDAQVTLSVRPRKAATLDDLRSRVRRDWERAKSRLRVT